jgi:hypothetical protein
MYTLFTKKVYKSWEKFLRFFGCVNLLEICFHVYLPILIIKLTGKNLQTNFDYARLKGTNNKP